MVQEIVDSPALLTGCAEPSVRPSIPRIRERIGRFKWPSLVAEAARSGPLAVRNFRLLSIGQSTSTVGDYCYAVALPWLILSGHGGTVMLGAVLACYGIPRTLLIPVGGMLADRLGPRALMLVADASRFLLMGLLAVLATRPAEALGVIVPIALLARCLRRHVPACLVVDHADVAARWSAAPPATPWPPRRSRSARWPGRCSAGYWLLRPARRRPSRSTRRPSGSRLSRWP